MRFSSFKEFYWQKICKILQFFLQKWMKRPDINNGWWKHNYLPDSSSSRFPIWLPKQCFWNELFMAVYGCLVSRKFLKLPWSWHSNAYWELGYFLGLLGTPLSLNFVRNASKKSGGSTKRQGKRQKAKHLGAKRGEGIRGNNK